jgi:hypothetical protein
MPAPIKAVRCLGCGHKVLAATCNSLGRCVSCKLDELDRDKTLEAALAEIEADERDRDLARLDRELDV